MGGGWWEKEIKKNNKILFLNSKHVDKTKHRIDSWTNNQTLNDHTSVHWSLMAVVLFRVVCGYTQLLQLGKT